jgi:hypothetical protein
MSGESLHHLLGGVLVDPAAGHLGDSIAHEGFAPLACELDHRGEDPAAFGRALALGRVGQGCVTHREPEHRVASRPGDTDGGRRSPGVADDDEALPAVTIHRVEPDLRGCVPPAVEELGGQARIKIHLEGDLRVANPRGIEGRDVGPLLERGPDSPFELGKGWNKQQARRCASGAHSRQSRHRRTRIQAAPTALPPIINTVIAIIAIVISVEPPMNSARF